MKITLDFSWHPVTRDLLQAAAILQHLWGQISDRVGDGLEASILLSRASEHVASQIDPLVLAITAGRYNALGKDEKP